MRWRIAALTVMVAAMGSLPRPRRQSSTSTRPRTRPTPPRTVSATRAPPPRAAVHAPSRHPGDQRQHRGSTGSTSRPGRTRSARSSPPRATSRSSALGARSTAVTGGSLSFAGSCTGGAGRSACSAELSDLTVRSGGGVTSRSHLALTRVTVRDNTKGPSTGMAPFGGGVFVGAVGAVVSSNLSIANSTISGNKVVGFPSFLTQRMGGGRGGRQPGDGQQSRTPRSSATPLPARTPWAAGSGRRWRT